MPNNLLLIGSNDTLFGKSTQNRKIYEVGLDQLNGVGLWKLAMEILEYFLKFVMSKGTAPGFYRENSLV